MKPIANRKFVALCSTALTAMSLMLTPGTAYAAAAETEAGDDFGDAITVTARRKEEKLTDVPVAVNVLSSDKLASSGVTNLQEMTLLAPGLNVYATATGGRNRPSFELRGISAYDTLGPQDQSIAIYTNETYISRTSGMGQAFYDLSNVQTLYGPQGTLFGRNSTSGAILITTASPTDKLEGMVQAGYGNYNRIDAQAMVNLPLGEKARFRLAGIYSSHDGYTTNLRNNSKLDDEKYWSVRGTLVLDLTDNLKNTTTAEYFKSDNHGWSVHTSYVVPTTNRSVTLADGRTLDMAATIATLYGNSATTPVPGTTIFSYMAADLADGPRNAYSGHPDEGTKTRTATITNKTELDISDSATLKNIFGFRWVSDEIHHDSDGTPFAILGGSPLRGNLITFNNHSFSNEFQFQAKALDNKLDLIVGAYWFREQTKESQYSNTFIDFPTNGAALTSPTVSPYISLNQSWSLFAQGTYNFTPQLSLTAGARMTWDDRVMTWSGALLNAGLSNQRCNTGFTADTLDGTADCFYKTHANFSKPTYTVSLNYKPSEDMLVYVAHRQGYRSGGFNARGLNETQVKPFRPETVKDVEIGFKGSWELGGEARLSANLAAYKTWYNDIQRTVVVVGNTGSPTSVIINAAKATIKGFEADITIQPIKQLSLTLNWAQSDAIHNTFQTSATILDTNVPFGNAKDSVNGSVTITPIDSEETGRLSLNVNGSYRSSQFPTQDMPVFLEATRIPSRTIFNASIDWNRVMGSPVSATAWIKNLSNKNYTLGSLGTLTSLGLVTSTYGDPRTFGFTLKYAFGQ